VGYIVVYMTVPSHDEAEKIVEAVLKKRFAACANIMPAHTAMYWWEGAIQKAEEVAVIFKTREDLFEELRAEAVRLHSYDCPAIVAMPMTQAHKPFLKFIEIETDELSRGGV